MDKANAHRAAAPAMAAREVLATERLRALALCQALHNDFDSIVEASKTLFAPASDNDDLAPVLELPSGAGTRADAGEANRAAHA